MEKSPLPSTLKYSPVTSAIPVKTNDVTFMSEMNSYSQATNNLIILHVRTNPLEFVDARQSFFMFDITNTSLAPNGSTLTNAVDKSKIYLDGGATCLFKSFTIKAGGQILWTTDAINLISNMLLELNGSDDYKRMMSLFNGNALQDQPDLTSDSGYNVLRAGETKTYILNLVSGFLSKKLIPTHFMKHSNLSFEILLENNAEASVMMKPQVRGDKSLAYTTPTFEIKNFQYRAKTIQIMQPEVIASLTEQLVAKNFHINSNEFKSYRYVIPKGTGTGGITIPIPDKSQCLKGIISYIRPVQARADRSNLSSYHYGVKDYHYSIGGINLPQQAIKCTDAVGNVHPQVFAEYLKCFNSLFNLEMSTNTNITQWANENGNATAYVETKAAVPGTSAAEYALGTGITRGSWAMAYDLQGFSNLNGVQKSGVDTFSLHLPTTMTLTFNHDTTEPLEIVTYCIKEVEYVLDANSVWQVKA